MKDINLRDYQQAGVNQIRDSFRSGSKRVLYVLPTGGGKTETFISIAKQTIERGKTVFFLVHKKNLVKQISERCTKYGLDHTIIAGSYKTDYSSSAYICSVQSLKNRLNDIPDPDLIIVDEAHHSSAGTWKSILNHYSDRYTLGVTATPCRNDGKGLGDIFNSMVLGPAPAELVQLGSLVMPEYYYFTPPDKLKQIKRDKFGEYDLRELIEVMDTDAIYGDIITEYKRLASGEPAIYSCCNIAHSERVAEEFRKVGYTAEAVHGKMKDEEIQRIFSGLASGSIQVVTFCDLISEGTDIPKVAVVGMLRKTASTALYLQIVGRGLRPADGKARCLILDHVGNFKDHGHPLKNRDWELHMTKKKRKKSEDESDDLGDYTQCESCYRVYEKVEKCCPYCGAENTKPVIEKKNKAGIAVKDTTTLEELLQKKKDKIEQGRSRTLEELWAIKEQRGYQDYWVKYVFESRVIKTAENERLNIEAIPEVYRHSTYNKSIEYINKKYDLDIKSLDETDIKRHIINAWNNFYRNKKKNYKKAYNIIK